MFCKKVFYSSNPSPIGTSFGKGKSLLVFVWKRCTEFY